MKRYECTDVKGKNWYESYGAPTMVEDTEGDYVKHSDVLKWIELLKENQKALEVSFKLFEGLNLIQGSETVNLMWSRNDKALKAAGVE